jgi:hypothetical protein
MIGGFKSRPSGVRRQSCFTWVFAIACLVVAPSAANAQGTAFDTLGAGTSAAAGSGGHAGHAAGESTFENAGQMALRHGGSVTYRDLETRNRSYVSQVCGDYLVVGETSARTVREPKRGAIIHLDSGEVVRRFAFAHDLRCSEGYLIGPESSDGPPWVLRTSDGRFFEPSWTLPDGASARVARMHPIEKPGEQTDEFLVSAFSDEIDAWIHGGWKVGDRTVTMREYGMRYPSAVRYVEDDILVLFPRSYSDSDEPDCAVQRISSSGVNCEVSTSRAADAHFLGDGWIGVFTTSKVLVRSPEGEVESLRPQGCGRAVETYALGAPGQGFLSGCRDGSESGTYHYMFWSNGARDDWSDSSGYRPGGNVANGPLGGEVMALWTSGERRATHGWLDIRDGTVWTSEPLHVIDNKKSLHGRKARVLAAGLSRGNRIELHMLDVNTGKRQKVDAYDDCPGYLMEDGRHQGRVILRCITEPDPGRYVLRYHWSEVIDLVSGHRWRFSDKKPELFTQDGRIVFSDIGPRTDEWFATARRLWIGELPSGS